MKILLTGGSGRLGGELKKIIKCDAPLKSEFDILYSPTDILLEYDLVVHCAAYTSVEDAEIDRAVAYRINVEGTKRISDAGVPILYISTEHVFDGEKGNYKECDIPNPANYYALTKLLGEFTLNDKSKIIRTSFKERPFVYPKAFVDQWTSGDYADVIAKEIKIVIDNFDKLPRIMNVGTSKKSIYELAKQSREVEPVSRLDNLKTKSPKDTSLNLDSWNRFKKGVI